MSKIIDFTMFHYAICLIFYLPLNVLSQLSPNITLGSSLTAKMDNNSWTSPSGEFAFGFTQSPGTGEGYLLAIWFNKIPEKTVIWLANRDNLAQEGSRLQLSEDGRFVLNDPTGNIIWDANTENDGVAYGVMLDTGNFVLASNTSSILWQSFDFPTDSLLPSQTLLKDKHVIPSLSGTNYSIGRFFLTLQGDGNLYLYTTNYPMLDQSTSYWSVNTSGNDFKLFSNQSGFTVLLPQNGSLISLVFTNTISSNQYYQRMTLDYDGVLRYYVYPKSISSSSTGGRPMAWSIVEFWPSNICASIPQDAGSGVCGYNNLCSLGSDQKPSCKCPEGYSLIDPNDSMSSCKPDFMAQSCDDELNETSNFGYIGMTNTNWPNHFYEHFTSVTEDWCGQICLSDCFCVAAYFENTNCYKKQFPLLHGRFDTSVKGKIFLKVRQRNSTITMGPADTTSNPKKKVSYIFLIVGSVLLGSSILANTLLLLTSTFFRHWLRKIYDDKLVSPADYPVFSSLSIRSFNYNELEEAKIGFKEELGRGSYSIVYKGTIEQEGTKHVAVKKLHDIVNESDYEINAEVRSISRTNHKNLVQLLGYCNDGQHRLLVYEYMSNGSLASYLFDNPVPNWDIRMQIAFSTARGLHYLHEEHSSQIIHCDIKPQNVLLDQSLTAKISDFGLAKLLKQDQSKTTTGFRGTRGYLAPEWFRNVAISSKVDVYSFGILLLEIVCCRKNIDTSVEDEKKIILSDWAYDCYEEEKLNLLIVDDDEAQHDLKNVEKFIKIAIWCIQEDPSLRPTMKRVVQMLEGSILVSVPPNPSSFISSID